MDGFKRIVPECLAIADYAVERLNQLGRNSWRHPYSNIVVFDRPDSSVTQRWQLACHGTLSHLITMPHVTRDQIDHLVADIQKSEPVPEPLLTDVPVCETVLGGAEQEITLVGSSDTNLLTEVSTALAAAGLSIEGLTAVKVEGGSIVRMRVNDRDRALQILNESFDLGRCHGHSHPISSDKAAGILNQLDYQAVSNEAVLVKLSDKPGSLATLMKQCRDETISIRSVRLLWRGQQEAVVEIASDEKDKLKNLLVDQVLMS